MQTEYFLRIKTFEKDEKSEIAILDKVKEMLGAEYYTKPGTYAFSASGGFSLEALLLSPVHARDKDGRFATSYAYRITDYALKHEDSYDLSKFLKSIEKTLEEKIPEIKVEGVWRVTATDVPVDWKIIREISEIFWGI